MKLFWQKVIANKSRPQYWPFLLLLWMASLVYRTLNALNLAINANKIKLNVPVVSVGNLAVGGAGKTPIVIALAQMLKDKGYKIGIVARGYGRESNEIITGTGAELCQRKAAEIGDEPLMMAECLRDAYFAVGSPKWKAAQELSKIAKLDVIIIDDGFQHYRLTRNLDIVAIDARYDLWNESIFPLGRLRESPKNLKRSDVIILNRVNQAVADNDFIKWLEGTYTDKPMPQAGYKASALISADGPKPVEFIEGKKIMAFSGIADNKSFEDIILQFKPARLEYIGFVDHCRYGKDEVDAILAKIGNFDPDLVLTTHKDYVKVRNYNFGPAVYYVKVIPEFMSGYDGLLESIEGTIGG